MFRIEGERMIIVAPNSFRAELAEAYRRNGYRGVNDLMAEQFNGANGGPRFLPPERIPEAMTDMPMLADWSEDDDGNTVIYGTVYGFPDYCITDEWEGLRLHGRTEFVAIIDYGDGVKLPPVGSDTWRTNNAASFEHCLDPNWTLPTYPPA